MKAVYTVFINGRPTGKEYKTIRGAKKEAQWYSEFSKKNNLSDKIEIACETENSWHIEELQGEQ